MLRKRICFFLAPKICILLLSACGVDFQNINLGRENTDYLDYACNGKLSVKKNVYQEGNNFYDQYRCLRGVMQTSRRYIDLDDQMRDFQSECRRVSGVYSHGGVRGNKSYLTGASISGTCTFYKTKVF